MRNNLEKTKKLLNITNKILGIRNKYQFYLPTNLSRVGINTINFQKSIILYCENIFIEKYALYCLIQSVNTKNKVLFLVDNSLLFILLKGKLSLEKINICKFKNIDKYDLSIFEEIIILCDLSLENLLDIKLKNKNISFFTNKRKYIEYFSEHKIFELEEFLPPFEIFDFARQFVPNHPKWNSKDFLNNLQKINSGADNPWIHDVNSFEQEIETMYEIIDENPTNNIAILLPFAKDENNFDLSIEKYYQVLKKDYFISKYYSNEPLANSIPTK